MRFPFALIFLVAAPGGAWAQGTAIGRPPVFGDGIACDARLLPWRSVWYGHFSGGNATYVPDSPVANVDWQDKRLCFASRHACLRWQHFERGRYSGIHGDWTCLPLR